MTQTLAYATDEVRDKYLVNTRSGLDALLKGEGNAFPHKSMFPQRWGLDFNCAVEFTPDSVREIESLVLLPVRLAAEETGFDFWYAGRDSELHGTLLGGYIELPQSDKRSLEVLYAEQTPAFERVSQDPGMQGVCRHYYFPAMEFPFLVVGGNNLTLNCVNIPVSVGMVRATLAQIYTAHGLGSYPMQNIFHISLVRLRRRPEDPMKRALFALSMMRLAQEIAFRPLSLQVERVVFKRDQQRQHPRFGGR